MNKSHNKLEQDMKRLELKKKENKESLRNKYKSINQTLRMTVVMRMKIIIIIIRNHIISPPFKQLACGKSQPIYHQSESANLLQCPLYGSASKQSLIPQVILASSLPLHTVVEED